MTSSNGNIFRVTGLLWEEFAGHRWIPLTKASDAELWFFYPRMNKRMDKQLRRWRFETPSRSLWRRCNGTVLYQQSQECRSVCVALGTSCAFQKIHLCSSHRNINVILMITASLAMPQISEMTFDVVSDEKTTAFPLVAVVSQWKCKKDWT